MVLNIFLWYLMITLVGWLAFPLARRLLAFLPDRGLALARPLGLLLWGYTYWMLVSLHVLQNDAGGVFFALVLVSALSGWQLWKEGPRVVLAWLRERKSLVISTELLFLALFAFWTVVRAAYPDASSTEKPMELAFINSILRSPAFPPTDPWLSGYGISYYYFGYVIVAALARASLTPGSVAFNLGLASWFALTGLAAYGLVYNLLALRMGQAARRAQDVLSPVLAPLFVLLVSNLEGFLELIHAKGLFWQRTADGGWKSGFFELLNIQEIALPPAEPFGWEPTRYNWTWRASRVLQDFDWNGGSREIIDEFPAFSYLLGDLHPHVLSMPFVLLAIGLSLNAYLRMRPGDRRVDSFAWLRSVEFWLTAVILGGLSFLNTWDFPIYLALFSAAVVLPRLVRSGLSLALAADFIEALFLLGVTGVLLYLPFYLGFDSQANGLLPSLIFFTRGAYFWVMFGSLLLPIFAWLAWKWQRVSLRALGQGALFAAGVIGGLWLLSSLFGMLKLSAEPGLAGIYGAQSGAPLIAESITRRLASPGAWLSLLALLALVWGLLRRAQGTAPVGAENQETEVSPAADEGEGRADPFVLLLILLGAGLVLFPEFFYLRDGFGWRMNTIFKFYFQVWIIWAVAAAYASAFLLKQIQRPGIWLAFTTAWLALIGMALVFPYFGVGQRLENSDPERWTLDGAAYLEAYMPDEMEAIHWLQKAPYGVVAEATSMRASYTGFTRVATHSGLPSVLGWPGHEIQWRGGAEEMGSREPDLAQLYRARTWDQALAILERYNIRYIYIGGLERSEYQVEEELFQQYLRPVYETPSVTIYEVPRYHFQQVQAVQP